MNTSFIVITAFSMFLIQIGVMISNYREMVAFEAVMNNTLTTQLGISKDIQESLAMTQAIIIASAKADKESTNTRLDQFTQIMGVLRFHPPVVDFMTLHKSGRVPLKP